jgi:hypothetical protein
LVNLITPDILVKFNKRNNDDDDDERRGITRKSIVRWGINNK